MEVLSKTGLNKLVEKIKGLLSNSITIDDIVSSTKGGIVPPLGTDNQVLTSSSGKPKWIMPDNLLLSYSFRLPNNFTNFTMQENSEGGINIQINGQQTIVNQINLEQTFQLQFASSFSYGDLKITLCPISFNSISSTTKYFIAILTMIKSNQLVYGSFGVAYISSDRKTFQINVGATKGLDPSVEPTSRTIYIAQRS